MLCSSRSRQAQACFSFQRGLCKAGSKCPYGHFLDHSATQREADMVSRKTAKGAMPAHSSQPPEGEKGKGKGNTKCWFFATSSGCSRGSSCKFAHDTVGAVTLMGAIGGAGSCSVSPAAYLAVLAGSLTCAMPCRRCGSSCQPPPHLCCQRKRLSQTSRPSPYMSVTQADAASSSNGVLNAQLGEVP
ncbi:unnamed protein product, partial [Polarella glacialis]